MPAPIPPGRFFCFPTPGRAHPSRPYAISVSFATDAKPRMSRTSRGPASQTLTRQRPLRRRLSGGQSNCSGPTPIRSGDELPSSNEIQDQLGGYEVRKCGRKIARTEATGFGRNVDSFPPTPHQGRVVLCGFQAADYQGPHITMPKRAKGKKGRGRPLAGEEFDRMLDACGKVRPRDAAAWRHYLTGLWLSGLRLEESLALSWDDDATIAVDLTGRRPRLRNLRRSRKGPSGPPVADHPRLCRVLACDARG